MLMSLWRKEADDIVDWSYGPDPVDPKELWFLSETEELP